MKPFVAVVTISFLLSWQSFLAAEEIPFYQQPATTTALQWYNQAQQLEAEGRYAEAVSAYNVVIQTPDATQQTCIACTWAHRGLCLERLGDYGNAANSYAQALQYGDIPFAREGLGRIQASQARIRHQLSYELEQRRSFCDKIPGNPRDELLFYYQCFTHDSSLPPETVEAIRRRGKEQSEKVDSLLRPK